MQSVDLSKPKRIVIIGGTKFIGPHVATQLIELGHSVTAYHRGQSESSLPLSVHHIRRVEAGMPVTEFASDLFAPGPDLVIHMIAMGEEDSRAALEAFRGRTERIVWLSSGDVYLAYGRFTGLEPGPVDNSLLTEESPLRSVFYPYRSRAKSPAELSNYYEKIFVERIALSDPQIPGTVLRLPKVYGPGGNADLATIYGFRDRPQWRWTHGYVENVAAAIVRSALHPAAGGRVYNVGEAMTPTVAERLGSLPPSSVPTDVGTGFNFDQNLAYDTNRIRAELEYRELVSEAEGLRRTLEVSAASRD